MRLKARITKFEVVAYLQEDLENKINGSSRDFLACIMILIHATVVFDGSITLATFSNPQLTCETQPNIYAPTNNGLVSIWYIIKALLSSKLGSQHRYFFFLHELMFKYLSLLQTTFKQFRKHTALNYTSYLYFKSQ